MNYYDIMLCLNGEAFAVHYSISAIGKTLYPGNSPKIPVMYSVCGGGGGRGSSVWGILRVRTPSPSFRVLQRVPVFNTSPDTPFQVSVRTNGRCEHTLF